MAGLLEAGFGQHYDERHFLSTDSKKGLGQVLLSKVPVTGTEFHPVIGCRGLWEARLRIGGREWTVFHVHLPSEKGKEAAAATRARALRILQGIWKERLTADPGALMMVLGDMNVERMEELTRKETLNATMDPAVAFAEGRPFITNATLRLMPGAQVSTRRKGKREKEPDLIVVSPALLKLWRVGSTVIIPRPDGSYEYQPFHRDYLRGPEDSQTDIFQSNPEGDFDHHPVQATFVTNLKQRPKDVVFWNGLAP
ncbi:MAG TPA: hypothetical protein VEY30_06030, partial [Myxococcaceae bacterium]|nr:hypothetical protein [Myxococcaceae bacterium]